jgi:hypothetical protein
VYPNEIFTAIIRIEVMPNARSADMKGLALSNSQKNKKAMSPDRTKAMTIKFSVLVVPFPPFYVKIV